MKKEYDFSKGRKNPLAALQSGKTRITIRLDDDVLDWFRHKVHEAGGGNYQTMINSALREHMEQSREELEHMLRRVLREELERKTG